MSNIVKIIGDRVRNHRNRAGLSREDLAGKAGLHATYIGTIERGEKNPSIESIEKIVTALNISFEALFENIVVGENENSIPNACYDMVNNLTLSEQQAIYELLKKAIEFRNL